MLSTPLGNLNKDFSTASSEVDSELSLSSASSTISIEDRTNSRCEVSKCVAKRTLVYEGDTSPPKEILNPPKKIGPISTKSKEVHHCI